MRNSHGIPIDYPANWLVLQQRSHPENAELQQVTIEAARNRVAISYFEFLYQLPAHIAAWRNRQGG